MRRTVRAVFIVLGIATTSQAHAQPVIESLEILSPWFPFGPVTCASPPGVRSNLVVIRGRGFGNSASPTSTGTAEGYYIFDPAPGRNIAIGGNGQHIHCPIALWTDYHINVLLGRTCVAISRTPATLQIGRSYYFGIERSNHARWLSNFKAFRTCP